MKKYSLLILLILVTAVSYCQPANNTCAGAFTIPVNSSTNCVTTLTATSVGATQSLAGCTGNADDDVWFVFTTTSANHTITVTPGTMNNVVFEIFSGTCAALTSVACVDNTNGSSAETINYNGGSAGITFYMRVYSRANAASGDAGTFTICVKTRPDPAGTNCMSGTQVCSNSNIAGISSGAGSEELTATSGGCLGAGGEVNSSWFYLNIGTTGTFEFTITPSNGSDDYDFAIWGPTNVCPPTVAPIRCNYAAYPKIAGCGTNTNPTGLSGTPGFTSASACQNRPYLDRLNVNAGEVYILLVNGFTPSANPFNMSFGGTGGLSCVPVVILPIELLSFDAVAKTDVVDITWVTASEKNNDYFTVERSKNAIDFETLKTIKGAGNSTDQKNYFVVDNNPLKGLSYYRLKQTDLDGKYTYSDIKSVNFENESKFEMTVFPNPSNGIYEIIPKGNYSESMYNIHLYNSVGEEILNLIDLKWKSNINLTDKPNGIYFLKIDLNGKFVYKNLIKE